LTALPPPSALGGIPFLLKLLGTRDFIAIVAYLQSAEGVAWLGAVSAVAAFAYGVIKTWRRGRQTVVLADAAPNSVAKVA
jgi:hypothetical protein